MKTTCNSKNDGILSFDTPESLFLWNELVNITSSCHQSTYKLNNFNWNKAAKRPRTLVCHDHRGGYLEYESLQGITCSSLPNEDKEHQIPIYSFFHWWYIDIFVYFSHHFVTVPPDVWILAAHQHGVLILGTFIIESVALFNQCFSDDSITDKIVSSLVDLCKNMNFDGWLINIENRVDPVYLDRLEWFLRKLRRDLRDYVHNCTQVIWYDSVVNSGKLRWQNELNKDNMRWFSAVDGFYTNYGWTECHLQRTLETFYKNFSDDKSLFDIYIGIDVFGRDCTGGWECFKPLEIIRRYNFSAAIFAPGWICETCPKMDQKISLFDNSERFWNLLKPYLFPHKMLSKQFCTNFSVGFSSECLDSCFEETNNFCMKNLNIQPFYLSSTAFSKDLKPGILINSVGMFNLFLCNILIEQTDRYLKLSYKSSFPVEFVIEVSNSLNVEHLLVKTKEKFVEQTEGVQEKMIKFSSHFNYQNTEGEEQKQLDKKYFPIENHLELNLQQKSGFTILGVMFWTAGRTLWMRIL
uniref:Mannosyl-glycoprotein endo-beta-N-acetylglucosaminidase n=1 Tax=Meloidogyne incognita TaxID=6306 RepID=A0A914KYD5_MELIC